MQYNFYGSNTSAVKPINALFAKIKDQRDLYDKLSLLWCKETCAPRMQDRWSRDNKTLGQCSITAFLAQDIFGGNVYGVPLGDGNFHCFNEVNGIVFDLTSEQFKNEKLDYSLTFIQSREIHFSKHEKKLRYEFLKNSLRDMLDK